MQRTSKEMVWDALKTVALCTNSPLRSCVCFRSWVDTIDTSHPRVSRASCTSDIDSRDAPADAVGPLFGYGTHGMVTIALSAATNIALSADLHSSVCVTALTVGTVHRQPIESAGLPSHV